MFYCRISDCHELRLLQLADAQELFTLTDANRSYLRQWLPTLKLNRVVIACATENHRSRAIPIRLGFTHEGVVRDGEFLYQEFVEHNIYALSVEDWNKL